MTGEGFVNKLAMSSTEEEEGREALVVVFVFTNKSERGGKVQVEEYIFCKVVVAVEILCKNEKVSFWEILGFGRAIYMCQIVKRREKHK